MRASGNRKHRLRSVLIGLSLSTTSAFAHVAHQLGEQIANHGINGVPACAVCHGEQGEGDQAAGYPRLAGMNADYLTSQLDLYAAGSRIGQAMQIYSRALTTQQRRAVADYYAGKRGLIAKALTGPANTSSSIATLLNEGDWARGIPACFSCHGDQGAGTDMIPAIADQPTQYFIAQMNHWRTGTRPVGEGDPMATISQNLTPTEISGIAQYLSHERLSR